MLRNTVGEVKLGTFAATSEYCTRNVDDGACAACLTEPPKRKDVMVDELSPGVAGAPSTGWEVVKVREVS